MGDRTSHDAGTISWSDLATTDQDAAKEFYGGLFGWEYDEQPIDDDTTYSMGEARRPDRGGDLAAAVERVGAGHPAALERLRDGRRRRRDDRQGRRGGRHGAGGPVRRLQRREDVGDRRPDRRGPVPVAGRRQHRRRGGQRAGRAGVGRHRHARRRGGPEVLRRAARLGVRPDERAAALLGDPERRPLTGRHDRPARGRAGQLVPVLRGRGRRRDGEEGRARPAASRSWARSTSPAAASR